MAQLKVERDTLPGKEARYWLENDVVIVQLGRDLTQLEERRILREARRKYGIDRRRFLPVLIPPRARDAVRQHPIPTAAVATVAAGGLAAATLLGAYLPSDEPHPRRRKPPAVAGPAAPVPGPSAAGPPRPSPTAPPPLRPSSSPGREDGPAPLRPTVTPVATRPAPVRSPTPPDDPTGSSGAPGAPPPSSTPPAPPGSPPPGSDRCLLSLTALGLADVQVLCAG